MWRPLSVCLLILSVNACGGDNPKSDGGPQNSVDGAAPDARNDSGILMDSGIASDGDLSDAASVDGVLSDATESPDVMPDAAPPDAAPPDAALPDAEPPDAEVPVCDVALLSNGNFDMGPGIGWTELSPVITHKTILEPEGIVPDGDSLYAARFGGGELVLDTLYQELYVPLGVYKLRLRGKYQILSDDSEFQAYDFLRLQVRNTEDLLMEEVGNYSNLDKTESGWQDFEFFSNKSYEGTTIRLYFASSNNDFMPSTFYLDSLDLHKTCESTGPCDVYSSNDACTDAIDLSPMLSESGAALVYGDTTSKINHVHENTCFTWSLKSSDLVYKISLSAGQKISLEMTPFSFDGAIMLMAECNNGDSACAAKSDDFGFGVKEEITEFEASTTGDYFIIIDGYEITDVGCFELKVTTL